MKKDVKHMDRIEAKKGKKKRKAKQTVLHEVDPIDDIFE